MPIIVYILCGPLGLLSFGVWGGSVVGWLGNLQKNLASPPPPIPPPKKEKEN
jgi:hypothetical protein